MPPDVRRAFGSGLDVSCGVTTLPPFGTNGGQVISLTAANGPLSATKQVSLTIGPSPVVQSVADSQGSANPITTTSTVTIRGKGFSRDGGNTLAFSRSGFQPLVVTAGTDASFKEGSVTTIQVSIQGRLATGVWQVTVTSPNEPGQPSAPFSVTVQ